MNKKIILNIALVVTIYILFYGLGDSIYYAQSGIKYWAPIIIIGLVIPAILYYRIKLQVPPANFPGLSLGFLLMLGSGLILGGIFELQQTYRFKNDLLENGRTIYGVIDEKWWDTPNKGKARWVFTCQYTVHNETYDTYEHNDWYDIYHIGDSVKLMYSTKHPTNYKILP